MSFGKKQIEQLSSFTSTLITYGLASFTSMLYITDWRAIVGYMPFYNSKFKDDKKNNKIECD